MMSEGFNIIYDGPPLKINLDLALIIDTKQPLGIASYQEVSLEYRDYFEISPGLQKGSSICVGYGACFL